MSAEDTVFPSRHALTWVGAVLAGLAGAAQLAVLGTIVFSRLRYPFDLEWMEGGMLCHALRIAEGKALYAPPSADFIAYLYTPLYPAVLALLGKLFGISHALGRLVSVAAFSGVLVLGGLAIRREAGRGQQWLPWALAAGGLIAASFQFTGAWYDLVRNDSLYLFLITFTLYALRYLHLRWPWLIAAGVAAALAFLTKQTASLFLVYSGAALLLINWRRLPVYVALVAVVAGGAVLLLNAQSHGWFWRYAFEMHQGHDLYWKRIWPETELKLLSCSPVVAAVIALWIIVASVDWIRTRKISASDRRLVFWLGVAVVGVIVSAVGFATQWASQNAYIPGLVFPALFAGVAAANLAARFGSRGRGGIASAGLAILVGAGLAAQLLCQLYAPAPHIPTTADRERGERLIATLREFPGPVLMPYHPWYPRLAGKRPSYPQMGINDVTRAGYPFPKDIIERVAQTYYDAILLDNPPRGRYDFVLEHYKLGRHFRSDEVPGIITGYPVRPTYLLVPRRQEPVPAGTRRVIDFEDGSYAGFELTGAAFGTRPAGGPVFDQGPVGPFEGRYLANSYVQGDLGTGRLLSPLIQIDRPIATYRVGGGRRPKELAVRFFVDGALIHEGTGMDSDVMTVVRVDLSRYLGRTLRVELMDQATGPWGHLLFDDLCLRDR